LNNKLR